MVAAKSFKNNKNVNDFVYEDLFDHLEDEPCYHNEDLDIFEEEFLACSITNKDVEEIRNIETKEQFLSEVSNTGISMLDVDSFVETDVIVDSEFSDIFDGQTVFSRKEIMGDSSRSDERILNKKKKPTKVGSSVLKIEDAFLFGKHVKFVKVPSNIKEEEIIKLRSSNNVVATLARILSSNRYKHLDWNTLKKKIFLDSSVQEKVVDVKSNDRLVIRSRKKNEEQKFKREKQRKINRARGKKRVDKQQTLERKLERDFGNLRKVQLKNSVKNRLKAKLNEKKKAEHNKELASHRAAMKARRDAKRARKRERKTVKSDLANIKFQSESLGIPMKTLETIAAMNKGWNAISDVLGKTYLSSTLCWLLTVSYSDSYVHTLTSTYLYLGEFGLTSYERFAGGALFSAVEAVVHNAKKWTTTRFQAEAMSDDITRLSSFIQSSMHCDFINAIKRLVLAALSYNLFSDDFSDTLMSVVGTPKTMTIEATFHAIMKSLSDIVKVGERLANGEPVSKAFLETRPTDVAMTKARILIDNSINVLVGEHSFSIDAREWIIEATEVIDLLRNANKKMSALDNRKVPLNSLLNNLIVKYKGVEGSISTSSRLPPFAFILHGDPGIGKSGLLTHFIAAYCEAFGIKYEQHIVYRRDVSSPFWEGFKPYMHTVIHYPELGCDTKHFDGSSAAIAELTRLIDTAPFPCNMAFDGKGMTFAYPLLVALDTNDATLSVPKYKTNFGAYMRRFLVIEVEVLEKYRKEGSTQIDYDKCNDGSAPLDKYAFKVFQQVAIDNGSKVRRVLLCEGDIFDTTKFFVSYAREYVTKGESYLNKVKPNPTNYMDDDVKCFEEAEVEEVPTPYEGIKSNVFGNFSKWFAYDEEVKVGPTRADIEEILRSFDIGDEKIPDETAQSLFRVESENKENINLDYLSPPRMWGKIKTIRKYRLPEITFHRRFASVCSSTASYIGYCGLDIFFSMLLCQSLSSVPDHITANHNEQFFACVLAMYAFYFLSPHIGILVFICLMISKHFIKHLLKLKLIREKKKSVEGNLIISRNNVKSVIYGGGFHDPLDLPVWTLYKSKGLFNIAITGLALSPIIAMAINSMRSFRKSNKSLLSYTHSAESYFTRESTLNSPLYEAEEKVEAGKGYVRVKPKFGTNWINLTNIYKPVFTGKHDDFWRSIRNNYRKAIIQYKESSMTTMIFGVCKNFAIVNTHSLKNDSVVSIRVSHSADTIPKVSTILTPSKVHHLGNDISILNLSGVLFKDITKFLAKTSFVMRSSEGSVGAYALRTIIFDPKGESMLVANKAVHVDKVYRYSLNDHQRGFCGSPLVASIGDGFEIIGIHTAGNMETSECFATRIEHEVVLKGVSKLIEGSHNFTFSSESFPNIPMKPLHNKSFPNYVDVGRVTVLGCDTKMVFTKQKSRLEKTKFSPFLGDFFLDHFSFIPTKHFRRPYLQRKIVDGKFYSPSNEWVNKFTTPSYALDPSRSDRVRKFVLNRFKENYTGPKWKPFDIEAAINGIPKDDIFGRMNLSTAGGYDMAKKTTYFDNFEEVKQEPNEELKALVLSTIQSALNGERLNFINKGAYKDEPVTKKTRIFVVGHLVTVILQRMFLGPFYSFTIEDYDIFGTAVGLNAHSEMGNLFVELTSKSRKLILGDYSGYDTAMPVDVKALCYTIILDILEYQGYNAEALTVVKSIFTDSLFPFVSLEGVIMEIPGFQPSGKYGTAEDNSLVGYVLLLLAYDQICGSLDDFHDHVKPFIYGDDVIASVTDEKIDVYNNLSYASFCKEELGVTFTSSDKESELVKYVSMQDGDFLKRKFSYNEDMNHIVGILDKNSLYKMLDWFIPSKHVTEMDQLESMVLSFARESSFYMNEDEYNAMLKDLSALILEHAGLKDVDFPSYRKIASDVAFIYDARGKSFPSQSPLHAIEKEEWHTEDLILAHNECGGLGLNVVGVPADSRKKTFKENGLSKPSSEILMLAESKEEIQLKTVSPYKTLRPASTVESMVVELNDLRTQLRESQDPIGDVPIGRLRSSQQYVSDNEYRIYVEKYLTLRDRVRGLELTISKLKNFSLNTKYVSESSEEIETKDNSSSTEMKRENILDVGGDVGKEFSAGRSRTVDIGQHQTLQLQDFLSRPVELANFDFTIGSVSLVTLDVMNRLLNDPVNRRKLSGYAYLKATIKVQINVTGMPYHYGKLMASWQPLADHNQSLEFWLGQLSLRRPGFISYISQAEGRVNMDVNENVPVILTIPYVFPQPALRLFNETTEVIGAATSFEDAVDYGKLFIIPITTIEATVDDPSPVNMTVYAWLEDVNLGAPTATSFVAESDERKVGPIENFASRSKEISDKLTQVPILEPYAKASSIMLGALQSFSALFGYSYPVMNSMPERVKHQAFQNGANTIGYDTGKRITYDPKQEVSVDPYSTGCDEDQMSHAFLTSRETYLTSFSWDPNNTPLTSVLFFAPVTPQLCWNDTQYYAQTPMSWLSTMHRYWRGDMHYTFEFPKNVFQKGKCAIIFEPNGFQKDLVLADTDLNKGYTLIVDLQETTNITFRVNWASHKIWLPTNEIRDTPEPGLDYDATTIPFYSNGFIKVVPFTRFQSPDGLGIKVNVYVSSPNMKYNVLTDKFKGMSFPFVAESKEVSTQEDTVYDLNDSSADITDTSELVFGEQPISLRATLKRFVTSDMAFVSEDVTQLQHIFAKFPAYPRIANFTGSPIGPHPFDYIRYAYLGVKGGVRSRIFLTGNYNIRPLSRVTVSNVPDILTGDAFAVNGSSRTFLRGSVSYVPVTNGGIEIETPYYNNNLFLLSFSRDYKGPRAMADSALDGVELMFDVIPTSNNFFVVRDLGVGDDFSFMRFMGAPPLVAGL